MELYIIGQGMRKAAEPFGQSPNEAQAQPAAARFLRKQKWPQLRILNFYNHLMTAGMLEFNPYAGKEGYDLQHHSWGPINDNPGFAPYDPNTFGTVYDGYAGVNLVFNVPSTSHNHAGIDFNGSHDFTTPVKTLIYVKAKIDVTPGTIMGIVGNTGNCWSKCGIENGPSIRVDTNPSAYAAGWGTHLHVQLIKRDNISKFYDVKENCFLSSVNECSYNPFNHNEIFKK